MSQVPRRALEIPLGFEECEHEEWLYNSVTQELHTVLAKLSFTGFIKALGLRLEDVTVRGVFWISGRSCWMCHPLINHISFCLNYVACIWQCLVWALNGLLTTVTRVFIIHYSLTRYALHTAGVQDLWLEVGFTFIHSAPPKLDVEE